MAAFLLFFATGCTAPNHLGNPLLLPIHAVTTGFENARYTQKRSVVKEWITQNEAAMRAEKFNGPTTMSLISSLPAIHRNQALADLKEAAVFSDFPERATVIIMVHSG